MSCRPGYRTRCTLAGVLLLLGAQSVRAWESDVHYGLTHWLARAVGFDARTAHAIAACNEGVDLGSMHGASALNARECLMHDSLAGRFVRDHHYPSIGRVPGYPETRAVVAGGDAARGMVTPASGGDWAEVGRRGPATVGAIRHGAGARRAATCGLENYRGGLACPLTGLESFPNRGLP